tara:strand:+ start:348 stop:806 length:459 start_codon:yes stop_codon:yes gene_type:complete
MTRVSLKELNEFVSYCCDFYGTKGIYDLGASRSAIRAACRMVTHRKDIPFDGDTLDRERVRMILEDLGYSEKLIAEAANKTEHQPSISNTVTVDHHRLPVSNIEGYHTVAVDRDDDCDHGPCTGYEIKELGLTVFVYDNDATMMSFHLEDAA